MAEGAGPWNIGKRAPDYTARQSEDVGQGSSERSVRFGGDVFYITAVRISNRRYRIDSLPIFARNVTNIWNEQRTQI